MAVSHCITSENFLPMNCAQNLSDLKITDNWYYFACVYMLLTSELVWINTFGMYVSLSKWFMTMYFTIREGGYEVSVFYIRYSWFMTNWEPRFLIQNRKAEETWGRVGYWKYLGDAFIEPACLVLPSAPPHTHTWFSKSGGPPYRYSYFYHTSVHNLM